MGWDGIVCMMMGFPECVGYGEGRYLLSFVGGGFISPAFRPYFCPYSFCIQIRYDCTNFIKEYNTDSRRLAKPRQMALRDGMVYNKRNRVAEMP